MRRSLLIATALSLSLAACGGDNGEELAATDDGGGDEAPADGADEPTDEDGEGEPDAEAFPVTVTDDRGEVEIDERPEDIISLAPSHTEILFAVGAGEQVAAVDERSDFPEQAPEGELSGFEPNVEAIAEREPDLVTVSADLGNVVAGLEELDIDVLLLAPATSIDDAYEQWETIGAATGHRDEAEELAASTEAELTDIVDEAPELGDDPLTYYHEVDENLFTATSDTFVGDVYGRFGLDNVADDADDGSGFPQLSGEAVIEADPQLIFLADAALGQTPEVVAERPGWASIAAIEDQLVFAVDPDLASRWTPRLTEFAETVADALEEATGEVEDEDAAEGA